jgi:hypothetical protein
MFYKSLLIGTISVCTFLINLGLANATPFVINGPVANGIDNFFNLNSGLNGIVTDINLSLELNDDNASGVDILLTHDTTTVNVFGAAADTPGSMNVTFDDEAGSTTPKTGPISGIYIPDNPLSAFDGADLAGGWTLQLQGTSTPENVPDLLAWSLAGDFDPDQGTLLQLDTGFTGVAGNPVPNPEPATMFLLGTGLVGIAGAARRRKKNQA